MDLSQLVWGHSFLATQKLGSSHGKAWGFLAFAVGFLRRSVCVCVSFFYQESSQVFVGMRFMNIMLLYLNISVSERVGVFDYILTLGTFEDDVPFTKVGYVIVPWRVRWLLKVLKHSMIFWSIYTPENSHGYPKWCFGKGNSLQTWPFWVSMLDFWVSMSMLDLEVSGQHANLYQRREWSHSSTFQSEGTSVFGETGVLEGCQLGDKILADVNTKMQAGLFQSFCF